HRDLLSFPTRRSSDLCPYFAAKVLSQMVVEEFVLVEDRERLPTTQQMKVLIYQSGFYLQPPDFGELYSVDGKLVLVAESSPPKEDRKSTRLNSSHQII